MNLGDGSKRAPGIGHADPLVDRHGRRQAFDRIDVGRLEQIRNSPAKAGQAFEIPPLALGMDRVKSQRALSRSAHSRQNHEPVARQIDVDILQVVDPCRGRGIDGTTSSGSGRLGWRVCFARGFFARSRATMLPLHSQAARVFILS